MEDNSLLPLLANKNRPAAQAAAVRAAWGLGYMLLVIIHTVAFGFPVPDLEGWVISAP